LSSCSFIGQKSIVTPDSLEFGIDLPFIDIVLIVTIIVLVIKNITVPASDVEKHLLIGCPGWTNIAHIETDVKGSWSDVEVCVNL